MSGVSQHACFETDVAAAWHQVLSQCVIIVEQEWQWMEESHFGAGLGGEGDEGVPPRRLEVGMEVNTRECQAAVFQDHL